MTLMRCEEKKDYTVVHIQETRIFQDKVFTFREQLLGLAEAENRNLIIDMSKVEVINSSGLGVLIMLYDRQKKNDGKLVLYGLSILMQEIFERMRLHTLFQIESSLPDAEKQVIQ